MRVAEKNRRYQIPSVIVLASEAVFARKFALLAQKPLE
jgi:hypothetical protein